MNILKTKKNTCKSSRTLWQWAIELNKPGNEHQMQPNVFKSWELQIDRSCFILISRTDTESGNTDTTGVQDGTSQLWFHFFQGNPLRTG